MKPKFTISMLLLLMFLMAIGATNVPKKVKKAFDTKFKEISQVDWEGDENGNYVAAFLHNQNYIKATFTLEGSWVNTITEVLLTDLDKCVENYIEDVYDGSEIFYAQYYEDPIVSNQLQVTVILSDFQEYPAEEEEYEEEWVVSSDDELDIRYLRLAFDECRFLSSEELEELNN